MIGEAASVGSLRDAACRPQRVNPLVVLHRFKDDCLKRLEGQRYAIVTAARSAAR